MIQFGDAVAAAASMCNSSSGANHCVFSVLPLTLPGQGAKCLKDRRMVEDELLKNGLDIGVVGSLQFQRSDHENDAHNANNWACLAMQDYKTCIFSKSAFGQGKPLQFMSLTRMRDMVVMENCDENALPDALTNRESLEAGENKKRVSYWERLKQRGTPATISIVEALINETGMPSDAAICLVEYFPSPASEYLKAVRDINLAKLNGNYDGPIAARIFSLCFAPDIDHQRFMKNQIQNDVFN